VVTNVRRSSFSSSGGGICATTGRGRTIPANAAPAATRPESFIDFRRFNQLRFHGRSLLLLEVVNSWKNSNATISPESKGRASLPTSSDSDSTRLETPQSRAQHQRMVLQGCRHFAVITLLVSCGFYRFF